MDRRDFLKTGAIVTLASQLSLVPSGVAEGTIAKTGVHHAFSSIYIPYDEDISLLTDKFQIVLKNNLADVDDNGRMAGSFWTAIVIPEKGEVTYRELLTNYVADYSHENWRKTKKEYGAPLIRIGDNYMIIDFKVIKSLPENYFIGNKPGISYRIKRI